MKRSLDGQQDRGNLTRRGFLARAGVAAAGGCLLGSAALASRPDAVEAPLAGEWPWTRIDPQEAAERAFSYYHAKGG